MKILTKDGLKAYHAKIKALLNGKSNTDHTHDETYYKKEEIDDKLKGKANADGLTMSVVDSKLVITDEEGNEIAIGGGAHIGAASPKDTTMLWIDTANGGILKYYNGNTWVTTVAVWG